MQSQQKMFIVCLIWVSGLMAVLHIPMVVYSAFGSINSAVTAKSRKTIPPIKVTVRTEMRCAIKRPPVIKKKESKRHV